MAASTASPGSMQGLIKKAFLDHPASVEETYFEHARVAGRYGKELAKASLMAFVHAVVPGLCCTSASDTIKSLHGELMVGHRGEIHRAVDPVGQAEVG